MLWEDCVLFVPTWIVFTLSSKSVKKLSSSNVDSPSCLNRSSSASSSRLDTRPVRSDCESSPSPELPVCCCCCCWAPLAASCCTNKVTQLEVSMRRQFWQHGHWIPQKKLYLKNWEWEEKQSTVLICMLKIHKSLQYIYMMRLKGTINYYKFICTGSTSRDSYLCYIYNK